MSQTGKAASRIVAGGGPAGMMTGYLLARTGINVVVLEKTPIFCSTSGGDTIHPSTMDVLAELGLLAEFLGLPHQAVTHAELEIGGKRVRVADLTHLPARCKFIAFIPQCDFLDFLADKAKSYPDFKLMMETEAVDLVSHNNRVSGVRVKSAAGTSAITLIWSLLQMAEFRQCGGPPSSR